MKTYGFREEEVDTGNHERIDYGEHYSGKSGPMMLKEEGHECVPMYVLYLILANAGGVTMTTIKLKIQLAVVDMAFAVNSLACVLSCKSDAWVIRLEQEQPTTLGRLILNFAITGM